MLSSLVASRLALASDEEAWDELEAVLPLPEVLAEDAVPAGLPVLWDAEALSEAEVLCEDEAVSPEPVL